MATPTVRKFWYNSGFPWNLILGDFLGAEYEFLLKIKIPIQYGYPEISKNLIIGDFYKTLESKSRGIRELLEGFLRRWTNLA